MKQLYTTFLLAILLLLSGCKKEMAKSDYTNVIPADCTDLVAINVKEAMQLSGLYQDDKFLVQVLDIFFEDSPSLSSCMKTMLLSDTLQVGINLDAPVFLFKSEKLLSPALSFQVSNFEKLKANFASATQLGMLSKQEDNKTYLFHTIKEGNIGLAYNDGTLLVVLADTPHKLQKVKGNIASMLKQTAEESIVSTPQYQYMSNLLGVFRFLTTPDAIPFEAKGLLQFPQNTKLNGTIIFENGSMRMMMQDNEYDGGQINFGRPYHPKNNNEIQAIMSQIIHGKAFNIELNTQELASLLNLNVLTQFAPEEPEVQALSNIVNQVEYFIARGNTHRTEIFVTLTNKSDNALKQLILIAKSLLTNGL